MVLVVLLEIVADDERRRHVNEAGAEAVHETVCQKQPLRGLYERRPDQADGEDARSKQATDAEAAMSEHSNEADRQRSARQR